MQTKELPVNLWWSRICEEEFCNGNKTVDAHVSEMGHCIGGENRSKDESDEAYDGRGEKPECQLGDKLERWRLFAAILPW